MGRGRSRGTASFVAGLLVGIAAISPSAVSALASKDEMVLGLPKRESILFAFEAETGSLDPRGGSDRFKLVLRALDDRGLWFADRPDRDSGTLSTKGFFGKWSKLGFEAVPPNAALVLEGAKKNEDAVPLELDNPRFDRSTATVRLDTRVLDGPSSGLAHLVEELDEGVDRNFGDAALFVDNAAAGSQPCVIGEVDYYAATAAANYDGQSYPKAVRASGTTLDVSGQYNELFNVIGTKYGGNGQTNFALPDLEPLIPGVLPFVCWQGIVPSPGDPGDPQCLAGNVQPVAFDILPNGYVQADGSILKIADYPILWAKLGTTFGGDGQTTFGVPNLPATHGLTNLICAKGVFWNSNYAPRYDCLLTGVDLFATSDLPTSELAANGKTIQLRANIPLYSLIGKTFGGNGQQTFGMPNVVPPPSSSYGICGTGVFPEFFN